MVERLTEHKTTKGITRVVVRSCVCEFQTVLNKLCAFEDIMEKYGIESVEELEMKLEITNESIKKAQQKLAEIYIQDRDTWKRACELACEEIDCECMYGVNKENYSQYFYQQAKKERNDE